MAQEQVKIVQSIPIDDTIHSSSERLHKLPNDNCCANNDQWHESFFFIQAADTQFGMIDNYLNKLPEPKWDKEIKLSEQLVCATNRMIPKPKFMVICGDLVDALPDDPMRSAQVTDFKRVFADLDPEIPLVCVCGNHDVGNQPTEESINEYKRDFGDDYFHFVTNGVLFIVINSQFYHHRANVEQLARDQDKWLDEVVLPKCKQYKYSIVFEHIPWFLKHPEEDDEYFNINRETRLTWLKKFKLAGVNKIMCGHYHRNAGGWYENIELVVTSAVGAQLGDDKSGVRIVKLLESGIQHEYYSLYQLPEWVVLDVQ